VETVGSSTALVQQPKYFTAQELKGALKMEAVCSSETLLYSQKMTLRNNSEKPNPEDELIVFLRNIGMHRRLHRTTTQKSPGDGGSMFLRNVGFQPKDNTAQQIRRALKMEAVCSFVTLVFDQKTTLRNNLEEP
jgi:hypothetical protein